MMERYFLNYGFKMVDGRGRDFNLYNICTAYISCKPHFNIAFLYHWQCDKVTDLWAVLSEDKSSLALLCCLFCFLEEVEVVNIAPGVLNILLTNYMT